MPTVASYMLNPTGGNRKSLLNATKNIVLYTKTITNIFLTVGAKCGYVWGATGLICLIVAYFQLPEMKGRSYREIDIMFRRRISARKWKKTDISVDDDE